MDDNTANELAEQYSNGTISPEDQEKLFAYYREVLAMDDRQIEHMLATGSDDYGKPDVNGDIQEI